MKRNWVLLLMLFLMGGIILEFVANDIEINNRIVDKNLGRIVVATGKQIADILLISVGLNFVYDYFFGHKERIETLEMFRDEIAKALDNDRKGIVKVNGEFDKIHFRDTLIPNSKKIFILQTYISDLDIYKDSLVRALKKGSTVEFLLMDPTVKYPTDKRTDAIGRGDTDVKKEIKKNLRTIRDIALEIDKAQVDKQNLKVSLYDYLPACIIYKCDTTYLFHILFQKQRAVFTPQMVVNDPQSQFGLLIEAELSSLSELATEIPDLTKIEEKYIR